MKRKQLFTILTIITAIIFFVLLVLLGLTEKPFIEKINERLINYLLLIFGIILLIIIFLFSKQYKVIEKGNIYLTESELIVVINNKRKIFLLTELTELLLFYDGSQYESTFFLTGSPLKSGIDNYISFNFRGVNYKYFFKSIDAIDLKRILKIINIWENKGIEFKYKRNK